MMENKTLAVVAGNEITDKDLDAIIMRYPEDKRIYFASEEGRAKLLEQTIGFELLNKFGEEIGLDKTDEFTAAVKNFSKEVITQMAMDKVLSGVTVIDSEAEKYFEENKESFKEQPTVSAKHILVDTLEKANELLRIAYSSGFKRSGIISISNKGRIIVGIMTTETTETIVGKDNEALVDEPYVNILVQRANDKLVRARDKLKRFYDNYKEVLENSKNE